jgi:hypothetical protein
VISKPIVAPVKGDPMRASWGAAVADRANECADAIDAMRGPGGLASLREPKAKTETPSLFPFKVRFEPSTEENAEPHDGDFLIYIPSGSLTVDGHPAGGADFGLDAREGEAGWYVLPQISANAEWWLDFEYEPAEDPPLACGMGTSPGHDNPDDAPGMIARSVHIANLEFPENARPKVTQITNGPLGYEYFVDSLNGLMGDLRIAVDPENPSVTVADTEIFAKVTTDEETGKILVGIATEEPDDEDDEGYCNEISHDSQSDDGEPGNDISGDAASHEAVVGGGGGGVDGNAISRWPCKKRQEENS